MSKIAPLNGQWISGLNEHDQYSLLLLATKLNEVIAMVNGLVGTDPEITEGSSNPPLLPTPSSQAREKQ